MKYILFFSFLFFSFFELQAQSDNLDSLTLKLVGTWQSEKDDYYITFINNVSYTYHKDSTISNSTPCPFTIQGEFIIVNCHPLEQTHYKIIELTDKTMKLNIYWLKLSDKEIIQGKPDSIRLKSKGRNRKYYKIKN